MFRPLVLDRKLAQQRRQMIDDQFKKEKVELSNTAIREVTKISKTKTSKLAKRKQQNILRGSNSVHGNRDRPQSNHSYWHECHLRNEVAKISEDLAKYPTDNQVSNKIGNKGCKYLSKMVSTTLAQLYLNNNEIEASGIAHLSKSQWPKLESLVLYHNRIGEQGIDNLLKSSWPGIRGLHLCWNDIQNEKKVWLVLGKWTKIRSMGLCNCALSQWKKMMNKILFILPKVYQSAKDTQRQPSIS